VSKRNKAYDKLAELGYEYKGSRHFSPSWTRTSEQLQRDHDERIQTRASDEDHGRALFAGRVLKAFGLEKKYSRAAHKSGRNIGPVTLFIEDITRALDTQQNFEAVERVAQSRPSAPAPEAAKPSGTPSAAPKGVVGFVAEV
jgi:hypothetical protein